MSTESGQAQERLVTHRFKLDRMMEACDIFGKAAVVITR